MELTITSFHFFRGFRVKTSLPIETVDDPRISAFPSLTTSAPLPAPLGYISAPFVPDSRLNCKFEGVLLVMHAFLSPSMVALPPNRCWTKFSAPEHLLVPAAVDEGVCSSSVKSKGMCKPEK